MIGDLNYHFEDTINKEAEDIQKLLCSPNLNQHVAHPTHIHGHILDLVLTRSIDSIISNLLVHPPTLSDHSPITLTLPCHQPLTEKKAITYRKLKDIDIDTFIKDLSISQLCTNTPDDLDKLVDMYNSTLEEILDNHAPIQTYQVAVQQQTKWYNKDIVLGKKVRRNAERSWCSTKLHIYLEIYKSESHKVKELCKKKQSRISIRKRLMISAMTRKNCSESQRN